MSGATRLTPPQQLEVVPSAEIGDLIRRLDGEFVQLERQAESLHSQALEAEAAAAAEGVDPTSSTWTMVRLQRFLDGLRDESHRDAEASLQVAKQRARLRIQEAHELAGHGSPPRTRDTTRYFDHEPWSPPAPGPAGGSSRVADAPITPVATPVAPAHETPGPVAREMNGGVGATLLTAAVVAEPPSPVTYEQVHEVRDPLDEQFWRAKPFAAPPDPLVAEVAAPSTLGAPVAPTPPPAPVAAPAPAQQAPPRRGLRRRLPVSAILEVLAVLLVLLFILLRLS